MGKTKQVATFAVDAGQWLVLLMRQQDYPPSILSVESNEQAAREWCAELMRRIVASSDAVFHTFSEPSGRMYVSIQPDGLAARLMAGASLSGMCELIVVRAETHMPTLIYREERLHSVLPGQFPQVS
ncbi:MAG: hypothetical protein ACTH8F_13035 [Microbacterium sp.]|uniref:hypothetical protein n=1 Tax=Microbacterium sp. TaxID=51671 RepID=UPI003F954692